MSPFISWLEKRAQQPMSSRSLRAPRKPQPRTPGSFPENLLVARCQLPHLGPCFQLAGVWRTFIRSHLESCFGNADALKTRECVFWLDSWYFSDGMFSANILLLCVCFCIPILNFNFSLYGASPSDPVHKGQDWKSPYVLWVSPYLGTRVRNHGLDTHVWSRTVGILKNSLALSCVVHRSWLPPVPPALRSSLGLRTEKGVPKLASHYRLMKP